MVILLCGTCQSDMYLSHVYYYHDGGNRYHMKYHMIDENNHRTEIVGTVKEFVADSAEGRLIQSFIEKTQRLEQSK